MCTSTPMETESLLQWIVSGDIPSLLFCPSSVWGGKKIPVLTNWVFKETRASAAVNGIQKTRSRCRYLKWGLTTDKVAGVYSLKENTKGVRVLKHGNRAGGLPVSKQWGDMDSSTLLLSSAPTVPSFPELKSCQVQVLWQSKRRELSIAAVGEPGFLHHLFCLLKLRAPDLQHSGAMDSQPDGLTLTIVRVKKWFLPLPFLDHIA